MRVLLLMYLYLDMHYCHMAASEGEKWFYPSGLPFLPASVQTKKRVKTKKKDNIKKRDVKENNPTVLVLSCIYDSCIFMILSVPVSIPKHFSKVLSY